MRLHLASYKLPRGYEIVAILPTSCSRPITRCSIQLVLDGLPCAFKDLSEAKPLASPGRFVDQDLPDAIDRHVPKVVADVGQVSVAGAGARDTPRPVVAKGFDVALARTC
jgi:hypothetical protein